MTRTAAPRRTQNLYKPPRAPRVGVALSGGAALGLAHIGALQAFVDGGIPIDCIAGTSIGAAIGAGFAFGIGLKKIKMVATEAKWSRFIGMPTSLLGLVSNRTLEAHLERFLGTKDIAEANIPLAILATDIEKGEAVILRKGKASLAVRASSCVPGLFAPVVIDGKKLVDGELVEHVPLSALDAMGVDLKVAVSICWNPQGTVKNLFDVAVNAACILAGHQRRGIIERADILVEPDLSGYSPSDFRNHKILIKEGYKAAKAKIPEIVALIAARSRELQKVSV